MSDSKYNAALKNDKRQTFGIGSNVSSTITHYTDGFTSEVVQDCYNFYLKNKPICDELVSLGFGCNTQSESAKFIANMGDKFNTSDYVFVNYFNEKIISLEFIQVFKTLSSNNVLYLSGCVLHPEFQGLGIACREPARDIALYENVDFVCAITQNPHMYYAFRKLCKKRTIYPINSNYDQSGPIKEAIMTTLANVLNLSPEQITTTLKSNGHLPKLYKNQLGKQGHNLPDDVFCKEAISLQFSRSAGDAYVLCSYVGGAIC